MSYLDLIRFDLLVNGVKQKFVPAVNKIYYYMLAYNKIYHCIYHSICCHQIKTNQFICITNELTSF